MFVPAIHGGSSVVYEMPNAEQAVAVTSIEVVLAGSCSACFDNGAVRQPYVAVVAAQVQGLHDPRGWHRRYNHQLPRFSCCVEAALQAFCAVGCIEARGHVQIRPLEHAATA